jgi:hypothetical protein
MGIDTPAFGRRVDRPEDFEAQRNSLLSRNGDVVVSGSSSNATTFAVNQSGELQFIQLLSAAQTPSVNGSIVTDIQIRFRVGPQASNAGFFVSAAAPSLTQSVSALPLEPGQVIETQVVNESSSTIVVQASAVLREG